MRRKPPLNIPNRLIRITPNHYRLAIADFDDAQRGFIAPLLDEGILRDANGKIYYRANDYKFDINAAAPETVNPSLWRQSQINGISGLFKVTDKMYQVRGGDISNITFVEGEKGIIVIDPLVTPPAAKAALDLYFQHRPQNRLLPLSTLTATPTTTAA